MRSIAGGDPMRKIGVILFSGGLDSTTVAAWAINEGYESTGLTFQYGQKHSREIDSAKKIASILDMKHEIVDVSFYKKIAWYSALTNTENLAVPQQRDELEMSKDIPITYVPLRNTFFITLAAAYIESQVLYLIEHEKVSPGDIQASIFIAANAIDYSGYPDCRPEYYEQTARALRLGSKLGTQYHRPLDIKTPIISMTKAEIVKTAIKLKAPLEYSWSCYTGEEFPCGKCDSCILRAKGFAEAGYPDPLLVRLKRNKGNVDSK
jgi:7-cyano-7-deazaguanine synthase